MVKSQANLWNIPAVLVFFFVSVVWGLSTGGYKAMLRLTLTWRNATSFSNTLCLPIKCVQAHISSRLRCNTNSFILLCTLWSSRQMTKWLFSHEHVQIEKTNFPLETIKTMYLSRKPAWFQTSNSPPKSTVCSVIQIGLVLCSLTADPLVGETIDQSSS